MAVPGAAPPPERSGDGLSRFGPYRLSARVAEGHRTTTFLGRADGEGPTLAIRILREGRDPEAFRDAVSRQRDLELVTDGDRLASVGPAVVGESLATVLDAFLIRERALPLPTALTIAMQIAAELDAAGGVHADLAPRHVLIGFDGAVHLIDAAGPDAPIEADNDGYQSPEHLLDEPLEATADVFVLGILVFEMTTGARLFGPSGGDVEERIRQAQVPRPRDLVGDGYPIELQLVLRKLMRPSPAGRFSSARAAQDALRLVATTRADIGPGPLGSWLRTEFADRHAVWASLVDDVASMQPTGPVEVRPRAPSRAQTHRAGHVGAGAATIEELRLDNPTLERVRRQIALEGEPASPRATTDAQALREELAALKMRRTELPAIPPTTTETTNPSAQVPRRASEDTHQDLPQPEEAREAADAPIAPGPIVPSGFAQAIQPGAARRRQGLAASPPPSMVPELPTEVTRRFPPLPQPLGPSEPPDSDAATSLDEIEALSDPLAGIDMFGLDGGFPSLDIAPLPRPDTLDESAPPPYLPSSDAEATAPPNPPELDPEADLLELSPEDLRLVSTDRGPIPQLDPGPAPGLSEDLVLDPPTMPPATTASSDAAEIFDDTIQDEASHAFLAPADLLRLQRAVSIIPEGQDGLLSEPTPISAGPQPSADLRADSGLQITVQDDLPQLSRPSDEEPAGPGERAGFVGSVGGSSGTGPVAQPRPRPPAAAPPRAPMGAVVPDLGLAPEDGGQAHISTQVVRDRIVPSTPAAVSDRDWESGDPTDLIREQAPLHDGPHELTPTPHLDLGYPSPPPVSETPPEEPSSSHLVIPISDDELESTARRSRLRGWALFAFGITAALLAVVVAWSLGWLAIPGSSSTDIVATPIPLDPRPAAAPPSQPAAPGAPTAADRDLPEGYLPLPEGDASADEPEPGFDAEGEPDPPPPTAGSDSAPVPANKGPAQPAEPAPTPRSARGLGVKAKPKPLAPTATWTLRVRALPESAEITVDGRKVPNGAAITLSSDEAVAVSASASGYRNMVKMVAPGESEVLFLLRREATTGPVPPDEAL